MPSPIKTAEAAKRRFSFDPFFTPESTLASLYDAEQRELACIRAMSFGHRGKKIGEQAAADVRSKYAARIDEHKRAWCLDGEPVCAHDAAILRGPEVRRAA